MAVFLNDAFTGTDGTFLPTHNANWEELPWDITGGASTERHVIDTNHCRSSTVTSPGSQVLRWNGDPGADEYDLTATISFHTTSQASRWHALFMRMTPTATAYASVDHYRIFAATNLTPNWQLDKIVGGTATLLDSFAAATAGTVVAVRVEVRSTGINVYLDGVLRMSTTDTAITQRGRVGIASRRGTSGGAHWLDDVVGDSVSGGTTVTINDAPLGISLAGPAAVEVSQSVRLDDSPSGVRISGPAASVLVGVTITDRPAALTLSGPAETITAGAPGAVTITDRPGSIQLGGRAPTVTTGVVIADRPTALQLGCLADTVTLGMLLADAPTGVRLSGPAETVQANGGFADRPSGMRLSGPAAVISGDLAVIQPDGALTLANATGQLRLTNATAQLTLRYVEDA